ncbi:MAG: CHAT domain-containing protein [Ardenticatenaceae bacterium]
MSHLQLSLTDYQDETRWRWVLSDAKGNFLADHEVSLDRKEPLYERFVDLHGYIKANKLSREQQEQLLDDVGAWLGEVAFGGLLDTLYDERDFPATVVRVQVPEAAQALLFHPFELAHLDGDSFAAAGIRLVYDTDATSRRKVAKDGRLRVLAIYSLPGGVSLLNLRRERYRMKRLVDELRQTRGAAVELRVIQYGATRQTLKRALQQGGGWDVIHISGHGLEGKLALEDAEGKLDIITTSELAKLLRPTRRRVKLLTLSACLSGAGSPEKPGSPPSGAAAQDAQPTRLPSLAQQLSQTLDCAALAMRYSVNDSFAIHFALHLYDSLLAQKQSLPTALQVALDDALAATYTRPPAPLSRIMPILFGARALDLTLTPPQKTPDFQLRRTGLLNFPAQPERFVGRLRPMLKASQALAPNSPYRGILFFGEASMGKTTCALELTYRHEEERFRGYVWFKAPDEGKDIRPTLRNFLQSMENQLDLGQQGILTAHLNDPQAFSQRTLPRLQAMLKGHATLIVIDHIDNLLTKSGGWRDAKWGTLINALLERTAHTRLVLTSRQQPTDLQQHPALRKLRIPRLLLKERALLNRD